MIDRLQKKCLIGSAILHGSLCGVLLICSAFGTKVETPAPYIEMVAFSPNAIATDGQSHGGAEAPARPQPVKEIVSQPPAAAAQPKAEITAPPTPKKIVQRDIERPHDEIPVRNDGELPSPKKTHKIKVTLDPIVRTSTKTKHSQKSKSQDDGESDLADVKAAQQRQRLAQAILGAGDAVARNTASKVVSDSTGVGGGGAAFVNYRTIVFEKYYNAWRSPAEFDDQEATVVARIVVARNGSIISSEIEHPSGKTILDRSVETALRNVSNLPAFPAGSSDAQRSFVLKFNLKSKLGEG